MPIPGLATVSLQMALDAGGFNETAYRSIDCIIDQSCEAQKAPERSAIADCVKNATNAALCEQRAQSQREALSRELY